MTHLLYIEDDPIDQRSFARYVKAHDLPYQYTVAGTCAEAKEALKNKKFDLVITDYRLPDGDGITLTKHIHGCPRMLITAYGSQEIAVKAIQSGLSDYLIKDVDNERFLTLLFSRVEKNLHKARIEKPAKKILVVEDDPLDQKAVQKALDEYPEYELHFAASSKEAKEKLAKESYDCALLDYLLTNGTGKDLLPYLNKSVVIVIAGRGDERFAVESFRHGAADYLIKDVGNEYLKKIPATIEKAFRQREMTELKETFINTVSHEMRIPISFLVTGLNNLKLGLYGPLSGTQAELVDKLSSHSERLVRIINDILDLSRLELGKTRLKCEELNVIDWIQKTAQDFSDKIVFEPPKEKLEAWADPEMATRVLTNLLSNALRFAKKKVELQVKLSQDFVQISVMNDGPGIPPAEQERIFSKFETLNLRPEKQGIGLGLSICKEIVKLHGGKIWVESAEGEGAKFHFTLPKITVG